MALTESKESNCKICKKFARKVDKMLGSIDDEKIDSYRDTFKKVIFSIFCVILFVYMLLISMQFLRQSHFFNPYCRCT